MRLASAVFASTLLLVSISAVAQDRKMPACEGVLNVVRSSEIKPGKLDVFLKAVADQRAWYKNAGSQDEIRLLRVIDVKTGEYSATEALTAHTQTTAAPPKQDEGFAAFVKEFGESSTITKQWFTCETK
jgi:hypothetical protein